MDNCEHASSGTCDHYDASGQTTSKRRRLDIPGGECDGAKRLPASQTSLLMQTSTASTVIQGPAFIAQELRSHGLP